MFDDHLADLFGLEFDNWMEKNNVIAEFVSWSEIEVLPDVREQNVTFVAYLAVQLLHPGSEIRALQCLQVLVLQPEGVFLVAVVVTKYLAFLSH